MSDDDGNMDIDIGQDQGDGVVTKAQATLQNKIEKQLRIWRRTGKKIEKLKVQFKETYGRDFVEGEGQKIPNTGNLTMGKVKSSDYNKTLPEGIRCCTCRSNNAHKFSHTFQLCVSCKGIKAEYAGTILTCDGVIQELDKCIPDYRYHTCVKCTAAEIKRLKPNYYTHNNLVASVIPDRAKPGGSGYIMDLGKNTFYKTVGDDDRVSKFNSDEDPLTSEAFPCNAPTKRGSKTKEREQNPSSSKISKKVKTTAGSSKVVPSIPSPQKQPPPPPKKKFSGCIYGKISRQGNVYIGDNIRTLTPRFHDISCPCAWCDYLDDHDDEEYISVVLYYFEKKEDSHHYEGMLQTVFALAQVYGMKLSDLKLPFPVKPENYKETWSAFDPNIAFPEVNLINTFAHGRSLTFAQYTEFLNMFKVLFNSELILDYKWEEDYLRYPKESMEVETHGD